MDFPGRLIAGLLAFILILVFPLQYLAQLNSENIDGLVDSRTHQFTDTIRQKGYLEKQVYEEYVDFLDTTGERYEIEIQDIKPVLGEDYATQKMHKANHSGESFMRLSYSNSNNEIQQFSNHTHTEDCYAGYEHICNGTDCEYEGGHKVVVASTSFGSGGGVYYSHDGSKWTRALTTNLSDITYGNGVFVGVTGTSTYVSADGINWTHTRVRVNNENVTFYEIIYVKGNGHFYATSQIRNGNSSTNLYDYPVLSSTDGMNWKIAFNSLTSTVPKKKLAYAGKIDSTWGAYLYLDREDDDESYNRDNYNGMKINQDGSLSNATTYSVSTRIRKLHQVDTIMAIEFDYLSDGYPRFEFRNYDYYLSYINGKFDVVQYGNGQYLMVKNNLNSTPSNGVYSTNDVKQSFTRIANFNYSTPIKLIYFGDRFLMTGYNSDNYYVHSSVDGVNWTSNSIPGYFTNLACNADGGSGEIEGSECLKKGKYYDDNGNDIEPICDRVVTSIKATHPNQTVDKGGTIITTAIATYLDGHTGIVNCTSNFNPNQIRDQTVTLTYTGLVGNAKTTGRLACTINVTVRDTKTLTSITVLPLSQALRKYNSPLFIVRAHYSDGTSKILNSSEYIVTGFNASNIGIQNVTISYSENGITKSTIASVRVTALQRECPQCHNIYELNRDDTDPGCPNCKELMTGIEITPDYVEVTQDENLPITVIAIYNDGSRNEVSGWTSNYNPDKTGIQIVTVEYGGHAIDITVWVNEGIIICPVCSTEYYISEGECPVCAEKVISINVDPKEVAVMQYEQIPLTVTAFFANGKSRIVDDWSIDRNTSIPGTYIATVNYKGASTTIKLTIYSINSIECPICGLIYDFSNSPKGCPVCSEELVGIEVYLTSGSNLVQLGNNPEIAVILIFRDDHREIAYDGYTLEGFNPNKLGVQTVKVIYKEFFTTIVLEVVNILDTIICPNGHVYYKNADGTDPGCPFCHTGDDVSKVIYFDITYTSEILNVIYSTGVYYFQTGNYISVIVIKKDKSLLYKAQRMFFATSLPGRKRRIIYGGEVF